MLSSMNLIEIFSILGIHWFADFVLQTEEQAKGKSKNWEDLLNHTGIYSTVWWVAGLLYILPTASEETFLKVLSFVLITFFCHTITDYITSRENSKLWEQGKTHSFFVCVGFDQYLHYIQLFLTYYLLINC